MLSTVTGQSEHAVERRFKHKAGGRMKSKDRLLLQVNLGHVNCVLINQTYILLCVFMNVLCTAVYLPVCQSTFISTLSV